MAGVADTAGDLLGSFLARVAEQPDAVAFREHGTDRRLTYAELLAWAERVKARLEQEGTGPGDFVAVFALDGPELIATLMALFALSAVAVPIPRHLTAFELAPILRDAAPVGCVTDGRGTDPQPVVQAASRFYVDVRIPEGAPRSALRPPDGDPIVTCHFTYKGLGYPLGALHRYSHYGRTVAAASPHTYQDDEARYISVLPQYTVFTLTFAVFMPLCFGGSILWVPNPMEVDLLRIMEEEWIRGVALVPFLCASLVSRARARGRAGTRLRPGLEAVVGGSVLSRSLAADVVNVVGMRCYEGYGLTETLPVTCNTPQSQRLGTLGAPLASARVSVVDAAGRELPPGRVGQIVVRGPTVTEGYVGRDAETKRFLRDGVFHTGDLGSFDADGHLRFEGCSLAITKIVSQMVDLTEVERVVAGHPAVAEVRTSVRVHPYRGERLAASVLVRPGASIDSQGLRAYVARQLSRHKIPSSFRVVERDLARLGGQA